jgi:ribosomal protein S20
MRFTTTIATASVAAVLGLAGVSVAGAAANPSSTRPATTATPTAAAAPEQGVTAKAGGHRPGAALRRKIRRGAGALIAKTIGITRPELRQELKAGKTIAAIATEHDVQPQAVIDALKSAATTKIDAAVDAGKITAERGAQLKSRLDTAIPKLVNEWHPRQR